jgi:ribosomal-protein-alanine N-acetyltransferase
MILQTRRLTLTPLVPGDGAQIAPIFADPEVMLHWDYPEIDDAETVDQLIAAQVAAMDQDAAFYWAMRRIEDHVLVGCCDVGEIDWRHRRAEIGFVLAQSYWGNGYALEAMHAVIDHMAGLGLKRLTARIHIGNSRSENLLRKLHFKEEGYLRGHVDRDGERRDCKLFGLLL